MALPSPGSGFRIRNLLADTLARGKTSGDFPGAAPPWVLGRRPVAGLLMGSVLGDARRTGFVEDWASSTSKCASSPCGVPVAGIW
jgi:hypothetical protein